MDVSELKSELVRLVATQAYRSGDFTLVSGKRSPHYLNGKLVLLEPEGAELFARWVNAQARTLSPTPVAVGGLELGAVPVACSAMVLSGGSLRTFVVRKKAKAHGAGLQIEGRLEPGDPVIVVDDVITTGGSTWKAIESAEAVGAKVVGAFCLVDRQDDTLPELAGYDLRSAMTLTDVLEWRAANS